MKTCLVEKTFLINDIQIYIFVHGNLMYVAIYIQLGCRKARVPFDYNVGSKSTAR